MQGFPPADLFSERMEKGNGTGIHELEKRAETAILELYFCLINGVIMDSAWRYAYAAEIEIIQDNTFPLLCACLVCFRRLWF